MLNSISRHDFINQKNTKCFFSAHFIKHMLKLDSVWSLYCLKGSPALYFCIQPIYSPMPSCPGRKGGQVPFLDKFRHLFHYVRFNYKKLTLKIHLYPFKDLSKFHQPTTVNRSPMPQQLGTGECLNKLRYMKCYIFAYLIH